MGGRGQQRRWPAAGTAAAGRRRACGHVPAKLSARAMLLDTGHNRKANANAVPVVAVRTGRVAGAGYDVQLEIVRMLADRREELTGNVFRPSTGFTGCCPH